VCNRDELMMLAMAGELGEMGMRTDDDDNDGGEAQHPVPGAKAPCRSGTARRSGRMSQVGDYPRKAA